jgi:hypothetical protein
VVTRGVPVAISCVPVVNSGIPVVPIWVLAATRGDYLEFRCIKGKIDSENLPIFKINLRNSEFLRKITLPSKILETLTAIRPTL